MLRDVIPGPVVTGPGAGGAGQPPFPMDQLINTPPVPVPFSVHTSGGHSTINLTWDSLLEAAGYIGRAQEVLSGQREELISAAATIHDSAGLTSLHWQVPGFHARLAVLTSSTGGLDHTLAAAGQGVETAHQSYRNVENAAQRWFQLLLHVHERDLVMQHLIHPQGDKSLVYDWGSSSGLLAASDMVRVLLQRFPIIAQFLGTVALVERHAGFTAVEMGRNEHLLRPEAAHRFSWKGDQTIAGYAGHMAEIPEHGDIAISRIEHSSGQEIFAVHLAGLKFNDGSREEGRGYLSLMDALANDSDHMGGVVKEALEVAQVPEGAHILLSGFSMGGLHAMNLSQNKTLREKYEVKGVTTIASPGRNQRIGSAVPMVHLQDGRDPVTAALGQRHQGSSSRLTITYQHHSPDIDMGSLAGSAHDYQHNLEAIDRLEQQEEDHLSSEEISHMDHFRDLYDGEVETLVFESRWQPMEEPEYLFPHEWEEWEDAQHIRDMVEEGLYEQSVRQVKRQARGSFRSGRPPQGTATPGTADWDLVED